MFNLPDYPDVYTTRHITCVSCKEKFAVTEGHQASNPANNQWRVRPNVTQTVDLYYVGDRQQHPVVPTPRQTPRPLGGQVDFLQQPPSTFTPYAINCPRCGADNRNWLSLLQTDNLGMRQRFPVVRLANYVLWSFVALALTLIFSMDIHLGKAAILLAAIPAAIFGTIWELTREWSDLRENQYEKRVLSKIRSKETELWIRGGILVFLFTIIFPIIFFSLAPTSFRLFLEFAQDSPESEVEAATTAVSLSVNQQINATQEEFADIAGQMQNLLDDLPSEDLPSVETEIDKLSNRLTDTVVASETALEKIEAESETAIQARRTIELAALTKARNNAIDGLKDGLVANLSFLAVWGVVVGVPTLIAVFIGMAAVKQFVGRVDRELPPPIFQSVARMTRLVSWEARQALEIAREYFFQIQWMSVDRNEQGGLDLVGLFREQPQIDIFGQPMGTMVRAQKYSIQTDKWCRVKNAKLEDVLVPIPANVKSEIIRTPRSGSSSPVTSPSGPPQSAAESLVPASPNPGQSDLARITISPQRF